MDAVEANGITINYRLIGKPQANPTIVFSNSLGTDYRIWERVADELAKDFTILLYDKRGHGLSDLGEGPLRMDDHVADLVALVDALQLGPVTPCGLSVGGQIVLGLYGSRPDLVRQLILMDTAHKIGTEETWNQRIDKVRADGIASMSEAILERWFTKAFREENAYFPIYRNMLERTTVGGYAGTCEALRDTDLTETAKSVDVPTMLIVGKDDGSTPPDLVRSTADLIEASRFEEIEEAAHLPCVEQPKTVARLIRDFIYSHEDVNG